MELVIVGYGNMAKAILAGILKQQKQDLGIDNIVIAGRNPNKIESFLKDYFKNTHSEFENSITFQKTLDIKCDGKVILLAFKPYNLNEFNFSGNADIVYSVLAGVSVKTLHSYLHSQHFVSIMPNVGATYALSSSAVFWEQDKIKIRTIKQAGEVLNALVDNDNNLQEVKEKYLQDTKLRIESFVTSFGNCVFVSSEKELNASIATNGSSPALLALVAQALINAGVYQGLKLDDSRELVQKTFEGIARLLKDKSPQEIKDSITSPGGTTARALLHCDENAVQGNITQACIKAVEHAIKVQKDLES